MQPRTRTRAALLLGLALLTACSSTAKAPVSTPPGSTPPVSSAASSTTPSSSAPTPAPDKAHTVLAAMTEQQKAGQLLMVGADSSQLDPAALAAIQNYDVGSVILDGNTTLSASALAATNAKYQAAAGSTKLFISTDQEGGEVRRLRGPDFTAMPSALVQGQLPPATLQTQAQTWAQQLKSAGINLDLAPVGDTVPSAAAAPGNAPIGAFDREFGYDTATVSNHVVAFVAGMSAAGVDTTVKHFPGLGRVTGNTDTTADVTDTVTTRNDAYLAPFTAAVKADVPFVMMSTAIYSQIDPGIPAAFSKTIVTGMLRGDLGFDGVVISDDLGSATQVAATDVGDRAAEFVAAGGDIALTVDPSTIAPMRAALVARAAADPPFAAQLDAAALRVLEAKQALGLLG